MCNSHNVCRVPTLLVASAADRLLPSMAEAARLQGVLPDARRVTLPDSGHTALLEEGVALAAIMGRAGFLPEGHTDAAVAAAKTAAGGGSAPFDYGGAVRSPDSTRSSGVAASTSANGSAAATAAQPIPDPQRAAATVATASTAAAPDASASSAADRYATSAWQMCTL